MTDTTATPQSGVSQQLPMETKPGWTTTEFWVTVGTNLIGLGVALATLFGHTLDPSSLTALIPAFSVLATAVATALYSHSRSKVKAAALQAHAQQLRTSPPDELPPQPLVWALVPAGSVPVTAANGKPEGSGHSFTGVRW